MTVFSFPDDPTKGIFENAKHPIREDTLEATVEIAKNHKGYVPILTLDKEGISRVTLRHGNLKNKEETKLHIVISIDNLSASTTEIPSHVLTEEIVKFPSKNIFKTAIASASALMGAVSENEIDKILSAVGQYTVKQARTFAVITPDLLQAFIEARVKNPIDMIKTSLIYFRKNHISRKKDGTAKPTFPTHARTIINHLLLANAIHEMEEVDEEKLEPLASEITGEFHLEVSPMNTKYICSLNILYTLKQI